MTELTHAWLGKPSVSLGTEARRRSACSHRRVKARLRDSLREAREAGIDELGRLLEVENPRDRMMTSPQARALLAAGHEVGAHTVSHPLLARGAPEEARWEMERSPVEVRERLGAEPPSFSFTAGSTSPGLRRLAREIGFRSCFVPAPSKRENAPGRVPAYSLGRLGLPTAPVHQLEAELDESLHAVRRLTGRYRPADER